MKDYKFSLGKTERISSSTPDELSIEERRLLDQIADKLLKEHRETLKKLGDE